MSKKEQKNILSKDKKSSSTLDPPELKAKTGNENRVQNKKAQHDSNEDLPRPIFKGRRFDLF
jgi:hypothetical protein